MARKPSKISYLFKDLTEVEFSPLAKPYTAEGATHPYKWEARVYDGSPRVTTYHVSKGPSVAHADRLIKKQKKSKQ